MPFEAPSLDTRTFEALKRAALLRIPRYAPEWTDFNESDPGITLVELFAWLTETMLYEMNRVPQRNYIKLLQLLGFEARPAQPAAAYLTFRVTAGGEVRSVAPRSRLSAQPRDGGDPLIFETTEGLDLIKLPLTDVQVFDGSGFAVVTAANAAPGPTFMPFGAVPQRGNALYLGFTQSDPPVAGRIFPDEMRWRIFLSAEQSAGKPIRAEEGTVAPTPPVTLVWEYRADALKWRRLNVFDDQSVAMTREGAVLVQGPMNPAATIEGRVTEPRFWLRVRIDSGAYPAGLTPAIDFIRPNVVRAENLSTVQGEFVDRSEGTPNQVFRLRFRPVDVSSLQLTVENPEGAPEPWRRVDDFLASGPDSNDFVLNATRGEVIFGDGKRGLIPPAGVVVTASLYRYGGGKAGNVPARSINTPLTALVGVDSVENERDAVGGADEQSGDDVLRDAPATLRHQERAVTPDDLTSLSLAAGGVAKARALALFHPDHPGIQVPGAVTVVIVPDNDDVPPKPSAALLAEVSRFLDKRRLLTTELYVKGPEYIPVRVEVKVEAEPYAAFDAVAKDIIRAINQYLDPLGRSLPPRGSGPRAERSNKSRPIGEDFHATDLFSVIQQVPMVKTVETLAVRINGQPHTPLQLPVFVPDDGMVFGTPDHDVVVVPYSETNEAP